MTRFAIDAPTALRIVTDDRPIDAAHSLVGPSILRSHALSALYRASRDGSLDEKAARARLEGIAGMKIRLLGDRVSRSTAFVIAGRLGWDDTEQAEYLAVAQLQADALITEDRALIAAAEHIVPIASYDQLFSA